MKEFTGRKSDVSIVFHPLRLALCLVSFLLLSPCSSAQAQQPKKTSHIGFLAVRTLQSQAVRIEAFRQGLRDLGYIEGQNIFIEWRSADENDSSERAFDLAADLVRSKVDAIVTGGALATAPAKKATSTIPIIMAQDNDPVGDGFVADLAHPGGNITGLTSINAELFGKQFELLKEIIPKLARVAFFWSPTNPDGEHQAKEAETVGRPLRLQIQFMQISRADDIDGAFQAAPKKRARALLVSGGGFFAFHQKRIIDLAAKTRMPTVYPNPRYVEAGGLMTYSFDRNEQFRRSAEYVDKILKGAKPADLPVERPKKFELVINLQAAKQIGLTIPRRCSIARTG